MARGERVAREVYAEIGLAHPTEIPIETLAYMRGARVRDVRMPGAQGRLARLGSKAIIAVSDAVTYAPRRRFVIAHEVGHLELHEAENQIALCDEAKIDEVYDQGTERESNAFATELLMPRALWAKRVDVAKPDLNVVAKLADEFQVSFTAAAIRFAKLCPERCAVVFSQDGVIRWSAAGREFGHWIQWGAKLDRYTLAYDYFAKGGVGDRPETVDASAWLASERLGKDDDLVEHSRPIPSLRAVLSLLWIPSDREF
ncbi:ImmA/IrrE family metallo-endopeptidase [Anaeromyxobacter diazotrophicus]|uniref:IrrE N-terminal-like domain-containing protein n=1 Tax=Anaeromyxobacter diazotrophicus TaxID=2590199 RepID=A0A7I9VHT1_9BACT|nr:ImmA/IrrE family metallo-endopeptidase [Anaeromyxobacter diazotrophicus]GEJ55956.1 hypothetical protein AMYX_06970 [Anaeromyxobacter diazotrophicus]